MSKEYNDELVSKTNYSLSEIAARAVGMDPTKVVVPVPIAVLPMYS
ncbi:hypothetical protein [Desulfosporosinus sp. FKB]|nr:hypothetical protein [Desulfosporosinus sp. FKB]